LRIAWGIGAERGAILAPSRITATTGREGKGVKVLLAIDGSAHSEAAIAEVARRPWPADTQVLVLTVIHAKAPLMPDPSFVLAAAHFQQIQQLHEEAPTLVNRACQQLRRRAPSLAVLTAIEEGVPKDIIVKVARGWGADLIVLGSHGYRRIRGILLGSVALGVLGEAPSSVLVARVKQAGADADAKTSPSVAVCH
jgi:nucleotide-binding universal stress UspA family protein